MIQKLKNSTTNAIHLLNVYQIHRCNNDTDKFVIQDQIRSTIKLGEICYDTFDLAVLENCKDEEEKKKFVMVYRSEEWSES